MNLAAVTLIADRLPAGLMHPGDDDQPARPLVLAALNNIGISAEQAAHFANEAGLPSNDAPKLIAEAIVHLLETEGGLELVSRAELEELRAEAATPQQANAVVPQIDVFCHCNRQKPLLQVPVGDRAKVTLDGGMLKRQLGQVCSCA